MNIAPEILRQCWILAGPTACGKTAVSLELSAQLGAEIIALDSMTLYRGMDIGTAKPSAAERAMVPHHLFDILSPDQDFSVADYVVAADRCCRDILSRGRVPLFVGGAGLYLRAILRGVFDGPEADLSYRAELELMASHDGVHALHARLAEIDPPTATRLHPHDTRRVIRALEVFRVTGKPLSEQQAEPPRSVHDRPHHVDWLDRPREELHQRINQRVEQMVHEGLIDEVRRLHTRPTGFGRTARQALGYKEVLDWLETGNGSVETMIETIQTRTRQFAKRQVTWFRNLEECRAVPLQGNESPAETARRLIKG